MANIHTNLGSGDVLVVKSKGGFFPHTHTLSIPRNEISNPHQAGVLLNTSTEVSLIFKHHHEVRISYDDLRKIRDGIEVTIKDADSGRHTFKIQLNQSQ